MSSGSQANNCQDTERRRTNELLEGMMEEVSVGEETSSDFHDWVERESSEVPATLQEIWHDANDLTQSQAEIYYDDDDDLDDGLYIPGEEEDDDDFDEEEDEDDYYDDDEAFIREDEEEMDEDDVEEEEEDDDGDDDAEDVELEGEEQYIDLQAILTAAASGTTTNPQAARTAAALNAIGLQGLQRLLRSGQVSIRRVASADNNNDNNNDNEDEEDNDGGRLFYGGANRYGATSRMSEFWDPVTQPIPAGRELLFSGEFKRQPSRPPDAPKSAFAPSKNLAVRLANRKQAQRRIEKHELSEYVPNSNGTEVARYPARCYCGQYSEDSSFFYTCTQDFQVHLYDTTANPYKKVHRHEDSPYAARIRHHSLASHMTSLKSIKTIQGRHGSWTITDANLSPDNQWMIYSSITPYVHLVPTRNEVETNGRRHSDNQVMLDFSDNGSDDAGVRWRRGIWSIRFSGDSKEIVAGAHYGEIYVYDIEARRRVLKVDGHADDVNGVAFADSASSNVLISGSDDSFVKVWDRRSLSGGKPAGVLPGHTEGITYVAPKGDGRYCISNGKDQSLKLWDLRKLISSEDFNKLPQKDYGLRQWDYRNMYYKKPRFLSHPNDCSVMTFRGHAVLRTLIRCHFSPIATTGQKYIYSGSADGRIHIWSLDGRVVQVLDRSKVIPLVKPGSVDAADPSAPIPRIQDEAGELARRELETNGGSGEGIRSWFRNQPTPRYSGEACTVRDVSWHSSEPALMSTAWDGPDGQSGSIAKHEWKGFGKNGLSLEDAIEKSMAEAAR